MYVLNTDGFSDRKLDNLSTFVEFWGQHYEDDVRMLDSDEPIDYFAELNLGQDLSDENVIRLLRWKDPKYLTHVICSGPRKGAKNERVERVLRKRDALNRFRRTADPSFHDVVEEVFPSGMIWRIFLYHMARPLDYPIADQHVFRTFALHTGNSAPTCRAHYAEYVAYFRELADRLCEGRGQLTSHQRLHEEKRLDNALMAFGQFLKKYHGGG